MTSAKTIKFRCPSLSDRKEFVKNSIHTPMQHQSEETLAALDGIPIMDCGEPLVVVQEVCPVIQAGSSPVLLRRTAAERLRLAQQWLETHHPGYTLRVGDGYRLPQHQARLFRRACLLVRLLQSLLVTRGNA